MPENDITHSEAPRGAIPDVSVVIVSWNVADLLADCLESLRRNSNGLSLDVWVVDNASADNTLDVLRERFPWVHVIANRENRGFALANNQAIERATGRFVFILNPDTIVTDGALRTLFEYLDTRPEVGMVGPRLRLGDGKTQPECARRLPTLGRVLWINSLKLHLIPLIGPWCFKRIAAPYDYETSAEVEAISGAAMLVRREVLRDLGGFGEAFIHCGEDIDLCYRVRAAGWQTHYVSECTIVHLKGQSSKKAPIKTTVNAALSDQEYFRRCFGGWQSLAYRLIIQCIQGPHAVLIGCFRLLLGKESPADLQRRFAVLRGLAAWRWVE